MSWFQTRLANRWNPLATPTTQKVWIGYQAADPSAVTLVSFPRIGDRHGARRSLTQEACGAVYLRHSGLFTHPARRLAPTLLWIAPTCRTSERERVRSSVLGLMSHVALHRSQVASHYSNDVSITRFESQVGGIAPRVDNDTRIMLPLVMRWWSGNHAVRGRQELSHIRAQMPRKGGNSFYRDKNDYTKFCVTLCGAPVTDKDIDFFTAGTKKFRAGNWPTCPACVARRSA